MVIPAVLVIALLLLTVLTLSEQFLSSHEAVAESWREMQERVGERARTDLSSVEAQTISSGAVVEITLRNDGDTKLADFDRWDVILQYRDVFLVSHTEWYPYGLWENEWKVEGIYLDASEGTGEAFEPDILNPGEEMVIWVWVDPDVGLGTTNLATIATYNGITVSTIFTR